MGNLASRTGWFRRRLYGQKKMIEEQEKRWLVNTRHRRASSESSLKRRKNGSSMIDKTGLERPIFNHAAVLSAKHSFTCLIDRLYTYFSDKNAARFPSYLPSRGVNIKRSGLHFVHTFVTARCSGKIPASRSTRRFAPQRSSWYLPFPGHENRFYPFQNNRMLNHPD